MKNFFLITLLVCSSTLFAQKNTDANVDQNPFFQSWQGTDALFPFDKIKVNHLRPAFDSGLVQLKNTYANIISNPAKPTPQNTLWAANYDKGLELLSNAFSVLIILNTTDATPETQQLMQEYYVKYTAIQNEFTYHPAYFKKIEMLYLQRQRYTNSEERKAIEDAYQKLVRSGLKLPQKYQERLKSINLELAKLETTFADNILAETAAFSKLITKPEEVAGLSETALQAAKEAAKAANKEGWLFTLQAPSYNAVMQMAENRQLRKELWLAEGSKASHNNSHDNQPVFKKIIALRQEMAQLLGFPSFSHYRLQERMAQTPQAIQTFLDTLTTYATPAYRKEYNELTAFARRQGFADEQLQPYDFAFYREKLKREKLSFNDQSIKPFFKLQNVLEGMFEVASQLYGIRFVEDKTIPVYHPDVTVYRALEADGQLLGYFYVDMFARPAKQPGAWMDFVRSGRYAPDEQWRVPQVMIVCNAPKPTETQPALLGFQDVVILFHEFGHALHFLNVKTRYNHQVFPDFVELPSQFMENFCYESSVLKTFAKHYQTNEALPDSVIEKIKQSKQFFAGHDNIGQIRRILIDMAWHADPKSHEKSVVEIEQPINLKTILYPYYPEHKITPTFNHIAGGYASGYYSYKWSEVLDADAYDYFKEKGIFNPEAARQFRTLLQKGGSVPPMELYRQFRGRAPQPQAMLRRAGLIK